MNRAAIYARVSTDEQAKRGYSLPTQLADCREYAAKNGLTVVAEFAEDYTGMELERPELDKVRTLAADKQIDALIVLEIDRLARDMVYQLLIESDFKHYGVAVHYVLADYADTPEGQLSKHLRASIAEYERAKFLERSRRGTLGRIKAGHPRGSGITEYGYRYIKDTDTAKGHYVIVPDEAVIVCLVFELYVHGDDSGIKHSTRGIARYLSERRIPTRFDTLPTEKRVKTRRGVGIWSESVVKKMLNNEMYAGVLWYGKVKTVEEKNANGRHRRILQPHNKWIPLNVEPIVSRDLWDAAQVQLKANQVGSRRNRKFDYLLQGRIRCTRCGSLFYCDADTRRANLRLSYRCGGSRMSSSADWKTVTCHGSINATRIDALAWGLVWKAIQDPDYIANAMRQKRTDKEPEIMLLESRLKTLETELARAEKSKSKLVDMHLKDEIDRDDYNDKRADLIKTISRATIEHADITRKLGALTISPDALAHLAAIRKQVKGDPANISFEQKAALVDTFNVSCLVERDDDGNLSEIVISGYMLEQTIRAVDFYEPVTNQ